MNTLGLLSLALLAAIYFAPLLVAAHRKLPPSTRAIIFVINLALGWTVIAWVALLIWADEATPSAARAGPAG